MVEIIEALKKFGKGILPHGAFKVLPSHFFFAGLDFMCTGLVFSEVPMFMVEPKAPARVELRSRDALHQISP